MSRPEVDGLAEAAQELGIDESRSPECPTTSSLRVGRPFVSKKRARDITREFTKAASALPTGQLVKDEYFTLFESVGALEIMDPKMDSGYLGPGDTLEDDYDVLRVLQPAEVLGIIDRLVCHETAWYIGHSLSQTLFTSLYIDALLWPEPKTLDAARFDRQTESATENSLLHVVLRAYCLALVKCCYYVQQNILRELFYEEEDFVTNLYHRELLPKQASPAITALLDGAINVLNDQLASSKEDVAVIQCLIDRCKWRKSYLLALLEDHEILEHARDMQHWEECAASFQNVMSNRHLGVEVPESFSTKIQRRLASTVPPRPIVTISVEETDAYLRQLVQDAIAAEKIFECESGRQMITFVQMFNFRDPQPSVYIRCLLQSMVFGEMRILGKKSMKQIIFDELSLSVLPNSILLSPTNEEIEVPHDPRFIMCQKMEMFVHRVGQPYIDISRALLMNRSRVRRMLCHNIIEWESVQMEADELDNELRPLTKEEIKSEDSNRSDYVSFYPLSSWAYLHKIQQMEWIIQLGFELDVYQPGELAGMYWYLDYISHSRADHVFRLRQSIENKVLQNEDFTNERMTLFTIAHQNLTFAMLEASATSSFACALYTLYAALSHLNAIPSKSSFHYTGPPLSYSLRMRPFSPISLPSLPALENFAPLAPPHYSTITREKPESSSEDSSSNTTRDPSSSSKEPSASTSNPKTSKGIPLSSSTNSSSPSTITTTTTTTTTTTAIQQKAAQNQEVDIPTLLKLTASSLDDARDAWAQVSRTEVPDIAGCAPGVMPQWVAEKKDVLRSVIAAKLVLGTVEKWWRENEEWWKDGIDGRSGDGEKGGKGLEKGKGKGGGGRLVAVVPSIDAGVGDEGKGMEKGTGKGKKVKKGYHAWWLVPEVKVVKDS
ncbi:hypothetical protein MMC25_000940 [Agyrium rufum]|nr:hypothetical protein [Agyrium rufum]